GGNTAGAVAGCLLAGFYLLRVHDLIFATLCAAAINARVALAALGIARFAPYEAERVDPDPPLESEQPESALGSPRSISETPVLFTIALSGFCALSAAVV